MRTHASYQCTHPGCDPSDTQCRDSKTSSDRAVPVIEYENETTLKTDSMARTHLTCHTSFSSDKLQSENRMAYALCKGLQHCVHLHVPDELDALGVHLISFSQQAAAPLQNGLLLIAQVCLLLS